MIVEYAAADINVCVWCVVIIVWCQLFDGEQNDDTSSNTQLFVHQLSALHPHITIKDTTNVLQCTYFWQMQLNDLDF